MLPDLIPNLSNESYVAFISDNTPDFKSKFESYEDNSKQMINSHMAPLIAYSGDDKWLELDVQKRLSDF